jgi:hypothetical protein
MINNDLTVMWQDTDHSWNIFGTITDAPVSDDTLYSTTILIWKKSSLKELLNNIALVAGSCVNLAVSPNLLNGFITTVALANLFPLDFRKINDDKDAEVFLDMIKRDRQYQYINKIDMANYPDLQELVEYFVAEKVLLSMDDKYIISGTVLQFSFVCD